MAGTGDRSPGGRVAEWRWGPFAVLLLVPLYLYARLFSSAGVPYFFASDQTFFWQYAERMLHGERIYRDFFQFTPPGLDLYFLALFRLFGPRLWVVNLAAILLGVALCWTCFALARKFMDRSAALLTALFFVVFVYGAQLDVSHHWFSLMAALGAAAVLMEARTDGRAAVAGLLLGVASFLTQTAGVAGAAALLVSLAWEHPSARKPWTIIVRQQGLLLLTFAAAWLALSAYFLATSGWRSLLYLQFLYPQHYVDAARGFLLPNFHETRASLLPQRLFFYLLLLLAYPWALWSCWRRRRDESPERMRVVLLATTGLFLLLSVITRSNWERLYAVSMPAVILLMRALANVDFLRRRSTRFALALVVVFFAAAQIRSTRRQVYTITELPAGRAALSQQDAEEFRWLMQHTSPGDDFLQASWPNAYLALGLRSPVYVEGLLPDRVPASYIALAIQQVAQSQVKYILWSPSLDPDPHQATPDNLQPFRDFMQNHYSRVQVFTNRDEIWQRL